MKISYDGYDYVYGMRNRGYSVGCQPMDGLLTRYDDPSGKYFDLLIYERKLTMDECLAYELDYVDKCLLK